MSVDNRLPGWFKVRIHSGKNYSRVKGLLSEHGLNTVCQGARCPNIWECWNSGTATFMILGSRCTRNCRFCGVPPTRSPSPPDPAEPEKIADSVERLGLSWAVLTSVTRDDLPDYGAGQFARCVKMIHRWRPQCGVELLIPDFKGDREALKVVATSGARVLAHNVETVPRLYPEVRPEADYKVSLAVLEFLAGKSNGTFRVKSSLIVGLGERFDEIGSVLEDLAAAGCSAVTLGQYLAPSRKHYRVRKYYTPDEFEQMARMARRSGIERVASGPLVRSSYQAHKLAGCRLHTEIGGME